MLTYPEFMSLVITRVQEKKERLGLAAFNVVAERYPHIAFKIRGTEYDPTYTLKIRKMCRKIGIKETSLSIPLQVVPNPDNVIDIRERLIDLRDSSDKPKVEMELIELAQFEF